MAIYIIIFLRTIPYERKSNIKHLLRFKNEDMIKYAGNEDEIFEILFGDGYFLIPDNHPVRYGNDF